MLTDLRCPAAVALLFGVVCIATTTSRNTHGQAVGRNNLAGQNRAGGTGAGNQNLVTRFDGKLKSQQGGLLIMTRDDGAEVMVKPPADLSKTVFVATAKPAFLRPGMMVRFVGTFNRAGVAQSPIAKVQLFQPVSGKVPANQRQQFLPGVYPDKQAAKEQAAAGVAKCDVVGRLVNIDAAGVMSVQAGKVPVQIPLLPTASFEIRYNNLSLAQVDDPVEVSGFYNPPDDTKVFAESITVSSDRVYGEAAADQTKQRSPTRRKRRTRNSEDLDAPSDSESVNPEPDRMNPRHPRANGTHPPLASAP